MRRTAILLMMAVVGCDGGDDDGGEGEGEGDCVRDPADAPGDAVPLAAGEQTQGFICPAGDQDFFAVNVPGDDLLLRVQLVMPEGPSNVRSSYVIYDTSGNLQRKGGSISAGQPLDEVSCLEAGDYVVMVHDDDDVDIDFRHDYRLTVATEPDPDESERDEGSRELSLDGTAQQGAISCVGDTDEFNVTLGGDKLLEVRLTSDVTAYEPSFQILDTDGNRYFGAANPGGSVTPTDIGGIYALPLAGDYVIVVADDVSGEDDLSEADPDVSYSISARAIDEPDPNDLGTRNDFADGAKDAFGSKSCGGGWDSGSLNRGYIASIGDADWYRVPLSGCDRGIMEVSLDLGGAVGVDPQIRVVRRYPDKSCERDEDCASLDLSCEDDLSCAAWGNVCVGAQGDPEEDEENFVPGDCQGAAACLGGVCGATQFEKNAPGQSSVATSVPIFGDGELWVVAQDFHSDGSDLDSPYTLTVQTREDPDPGERDNVYNPYPRRIVDRGANRDVARGPFGIGFTAEGVLATEADEDWFYFTNPCAGTAPDTCQMNVEMHLDPGPVDWIVTLVRGRRDWFQTAFVEEGDSSGVDYTYGPGSECLFSVAEDEGYWLLVYDNQGIADIEGTPDWSISQGYSITVTGSSSPSCPEPCVMHGDPEPGCNVD
ncbi:MAG: hypothetical protein HYY06_00545 [Deltaproteobacteria bacterium]|nr:hypothetical protein [Deltaproteobacteria bacterium]